MTQFFIFLLSNTENVLTNPCTMHVRTILKLSRLKQLKKGENYTISENIHFPAFANV